MRLEVVECHCQVCRVISMGLLPTSNVSGHHTLCYVNLMSVDSEEIEYIAIAKVEGFQNLLARFTLTPSCIDEVRHIPTSVTTY